MQQSQSAESAESAQAVQCGLPVQCGLAAPRVNGAPPAGLVFEAPELSKDAYGKTNPLTEGNWAPFFLVGATILLTFAVGMVFGH